MIDFNECVTNQTQITIIPDEKYKKGFFKRKKTSTPNVYLKKFNPAEFIGEELCNIQNIRCSHYFLAGIGRFSSSHQCKYGDAKGLYLDYKIASYDFRRNDCDYKTIDDYDLNPNNDAFTEMLNQTNDERNREQLCKDMLELLALDIYMGQVDRHEGNFLFEENQEHNIRLAPVFDFEFSMNPSNLPQKNILEGDLYTFHNLEECHKFIKKYPMFRDILASYLEIDLLDTINDCYTRRGLQIPDSKWEYYDEFEQNRQKVIKKIIR